METISKVEKFKYQDKLFDTEEAACIYAARLLIAGPDPEGRGAVPIRIKDVESNLKKNARQIITFLQKVKESA